uniref:Syndecan n=1 Tax=Canis lupus familiaris TaxID=9615 RepID=A0A8C0TGN2_CANLF
GREGREGRGGEGSGEGREGEGSRGPRTRTHRLEPRRGARAPAGVALQDRLGPLDSHGASPPPGARGGEGGGGRGRGRRGRGEGEEGAEREAVARAGRGGGRREAGGGRRRREPQSALVRASPQSRGAAAAPCPPRPARPARPAPRCALPPARRVPAQRPPGSARPGSALRVRPQREPRREPRRSRRGAAAAARGSQQVRRRRVPGAAGGAAGAGEAGEPRPGPARPDPTSTSTRPGPARRLSAGWRRPAWRSLQARPERPVPGTCGAPGSCSPWAWRPARRRRNLSLLLEEAPGLPWAALGSPTLRLGVPRFLPSDQEQMLPSELPAPCGRCSLRQLEDHPKADERAELTSDKDMYLDNSSVEEASGVYPIDDDDYASASGSGADEDGESPEPTASQPLPNAGPTSAVPAAEATTLKTRGKEPAQTESPEEIGEDKVRLSDSERKVDPSDEDANVYTEKHSDNLFKRTEVLAAVIAGGVIGFLFAIFLILLLVYRMRKKDEGSYDLGERKPSSAAYQKAPTKEFYA